MHHLLYKGTTELLYSVNGETQCALGITVSEELKLVKCIIEVSCELNENNILEEVSDVFD